MATSTVTVQQDVVFESSEAFAYLKRCLNVNAGFAGDTTIRSPSLDIVVLSCCALCLGLSVEMGGGGDSNLDANDLAFFSVL